MKLIGVAPGEWDLKPGEEFDAYHKRTSSMLDKLMKMSDGFDGGGLTGSIITFPVGDGRAMYQIVNEKPLTCFLIPYGDAYQIDPAFMRGLRLSDVRALVKMQRKLKGIFCKK